MASFDLEDMRGLDGQLMRMGPVTLFWRLELFEDALDWLRAAGYTILAVDVAQCGNEAEFRDAIYRALDCPDFGPLTPSLNLDALNDFVGSVAVFEHGSVRASTGTVIAFSHFDLFARSAAKTADNLLDIFADQAWGALLIGHRMMVLVQTDSPDLEIGPLGARRVWWNPAEMLDIARHPDRAPRNAGEAMWLLRKDSPPPWRRP